MAMFCFLVQTELTELLVAREKELDVQVVTLASKCVAQGKKLEALEARLQVEHLGCFVLYKQVSLVLFFTSKPHSLVLFFTSKPHFTLCLCVSDKQNRLQANKPRTKQQKQQNLVELCVLEGKKKQKQDDMCVCLCMSY